MIRTDRSRGPQPGDRRTVTQEYRRSGSIGGWVTVDDQPRERPNETRFIAWHPKDIASQLRAQERAQLDPELSGFLGAAAGYIDAAEAELAALRSAPVGMPKQKHSNEALGAYLRYYELVDDTNNPNLQRARDLHALRAWAASQKDVRAALTEVVGCFDAAETEGLTQRLAECHERAVGSLYDLITRRVLHAYDAARRALLDNPAPISPEPPRDESAEGDAAFVERMAQETQNRAWQLCEDDVERLITLARATNSPVTGEAAK